MMKIQSARKAAGFTLVDMMCAVAITGVLSSVALPAYQGVVHKVRRSEARVALWQLQLAQERYRSDHSSYGTLAEIGAAATSPSGQYALSIESANDTGFRARAVAVGVQSSDRACRYMQLASDGVDVTHLSGADASLSNTEAANRQCWGI